MDRSSAATQQVPIVYVGTSLNPCVDESDSLTLNIFNNAVAGATIQLDLYYALGS